MRSAALREFLAFLAHATSAGFVEDVLMETRIAPDAPTSGEADLIASLITLMRHASGKTGYAFDDMAEDYGRWMFAAAIRDQPELFKDVQDLRGLFETVANMFNHLHDHAPDVAPSLRLIETEGAMLEVVYQSAHGLASLFAGLVQAALAHYGAESAIERADREPMGVHAAFTIRFQA